MQRWPDLRATLAGIPWVVVGGVATRAYMPERMTRDLDVLVHQADADRTIACLVGAGYVDLGPLSVPGHALRAPDGTKVYGLFGGDDEAPWLSEALAEPARDAAGFPVIGLPYLVLLKLGAARTQDWADVSRMVGQADEDQLEAVRTAVQRWAPEDAEDLEGLIVLGQQELRSGEG